MDEVIIDEQVFCDITEDLLFDLDMDITSNVSEPLDDEAASEVDRNNDPLDNLLRQVTSCLESDDFQNQVMRDISAAKALLPARTTLESVAQALPTYPHHRLVVREALGSSAPTTCLTQLRHSFLVLQKDSPSALSASCTELIVDPWFHESFAIGNSCPRYQGLLDAIPEVYVGSAGALKSLVTLIAGEISKCYKSRKMPVPPWRTAKALLSKWLSSTTRDRLVLRQQVSIPLFPSTDCVLIASRPMSCNASLPGSERWACRQDSPYEEDSAHHMPTVYGFAPTQPLPSSGLVCRPQQRELTPGLPHVKPPAKSALSAHVSVKQKHQMLPTAIKAMDRTKAQGVVFTAAGEKQVQGRPGLQQVSGLEVVGRLPQNDVSCPEVLVPDHKFFLNTLMAPIRKVKLEGKSSCKGNYPFATQKVVRMPQR